MKTYEKLNTWYVEWQTPVIVVVVVVRYAWLSVFSNATKNPVSAYNYASYPSLPTRESRFYNFAHSSAMLLKTSNNGLM
jgi:hypothetical protein